MADYRIEQHSIIPIPLKQEIDFFWQNTRMTALDGEMIASALFANGIHVFGHHVKDGSPQGIFCANGQCSQCLVLVNGQPVKACMVLVKRGIGFEPLDQLPVVPKTAFPPKTHPIEEIEIPVLIIGGGPSGLSASIEFGKLGIETILVDDKHRLGGKLVLQTHRFFGSSDNVYAGTAWN